MKIKVCGLKYKDNIKEIVSLRPDYIGLIFYEKSPRFIEKLSSEFIKSINNVNKTGVFVDSSPEYIKSAITEYGLNTIQLHGDETPEMCIKIKSFGVSVSKAFSVDEYFNFDTLKAYTKCIDFFLFDTKGKERGGNGLKFNWDILKKYNEKLPFMLSGGIDINDIDKIKHIDNPNLFAIDINSKFETKPGFKNIVETRNAMSLRDKYNKI